MILHAGRGALTVTPIAVNASRSDTRPHGWPAAHPMKFVSRMRCTRSATNSPVFCSINQ